ncbi:MAG TPA: methyltransferase domain-containing protein [Candidatus Binatia bacterium]|nr:methyltransferase domain-containing protein [Candidatus Binatia bacterium]
MTGAVRLGPHDRLKPVDLVPPLPPGTVLHVRDAERARPGLHLVRSGGRLALVQGPVGDGVELLGRVAAVEFRGRRFGLDRGLLGQVPLSWLARTLRGLEAAARVLNPLEPPLFLGDERACLESVRVKYSQLLDVERYAAGPAGLEPWEEALVRAHVPPGGRVLDIGCGAGREAIGLARAGYRVLGLDIAPAMVEAARRRAAEERLDITFSVGSVTDLDVPPGSFDAAFWAGSYHHVPGRALRVRTLERLRRALVPGGVLLLMVVYRGPRGWILSRSRLVDGLRALGRRLGVAHALSEPGDGYMREVSEASDPSRPCFFHDFDRPAEVRGEIEAAGFGADEAMPGWWVCRPAPARSAGE